MSEFVPPQHIQFLLLDADGTLTDGGVYIDENGTQSRKFNIKDGMGIRQLLKEGVQVGFLSHSSCDALIRERADMLNVNFVYTGIEPKIAILNQWLKELSIGLDNV